MGSLGRIHGGAGPGPHSRRFTQVPGTLHEEAGLRHSLAPYFCSGISQVVVWEEKGFRD